MKPPAGRLMATEIAAIPDVVERQLHDQLPLYVRLGHDPDAPPHLVKAPLTE